MRGLRRKRIAALSIIMSHSQCNVGRLLIKLHFFNVFKFKNIKGLFGYHLLLKTENTITE